MIAQTLAETSRILAESGSDTDSPWVLLLAGPLGGALVYWLLFRYYRNVDKSHSFETETIIEAQPVTGNDHKINAIRGTKRTKINGDNVSSHRSRVRRIH